MLNGIVNIYKAVINKVADAVTGIISYTPIPVPKQTIKVNFDTTQLIPNTINAQAYPQWIGAYLSKLPASSLILWHHQQQLHLAYIHNANVVHQQVANVSLEAQTQFIQIADEKISLNELLNNATLNPRPPRNLVLVEPDRISAVKFPVQLKMKHINESLIAHQTQTANRALENIEHSLTCNLCLDDYSPENPPYLVKTTASVYHYDCFRQHKEHRGYQELRDPKSNKLLARQAQNASLDSLLAKDEAYLLSLHDVKPLNKTTKHFKKMLTILLDENRELKNRLAQAQQQAVQNPVQPESTVNAQRPSPRNTQV